MLSRVARLRQLGEVVGGWEVFALTDCRAVVFFVFLGTPDGRRNGAGRLLLLIVGLFVAAAVYGSAKKALIRPLAFVVESLVRARHWSATTARRSLPGGGGSPPP